MTYNPYHTALSELKSSESIDWHKDKARALLRVSVTASVHTVKVITGIVIRRVQAQMGRKVGQPMLSSVQDIPVDPVVAEELAVIAPAPIESTLDIAAPAEDMPSPSSSVTSRFTSEELQVLTVKKLRQLARQQGVVVEDGISISNANKSQLIIALASTDGR